MSGQCGNLARREVGDADSADLAGFHRSLQRAGDLGGVGQDVRAMDLPQRPRCSTPRRVKEASIAAVR